MYLLPIARCSHMLLFGFIAIASAKKPLQSRQHAPPPIPQSLETCLEQTAITIVSPSSSSYSTTAKSQNTIYSYHPSAILLPKSTSEIASAVTCLSSQAGKIKASTFGGGHGYASYALGGADGYVVIDSQNLQTIDINTVKKTVKVGAGVKIGPLAKKIGEVGFGLPHGTCSSVGVIAHAVGGGWGFSSRKWGWLLDHIIGITLVDPQGRVQELNAQSGDIWWAIRGAGSNNFGVIADVTFSILDAPKKSVNWKTILQKNDECAKALIMFQELGLKFNTSDALPNEFGAQLLLYGENGGDPGACSFAGQFLGPIDGLRKVENEILANMKGRGVTMPPFNATEFPSWTETLTNLMGNLDAPPNKVPYYAQSLMDDGSPGYSLQTATVIANAMQKTVNVSDSGTSLSFDLNGSSAGTNGDQPNGPAVWEDAGKRKALFLSQLYVYNYPGFDKASEQNAVNAVVDGVNEAVKAANPNDVWGAYVNYVDPRLKNWEQMYYGQSHVVKRLKEIKRTIDPQTIFDYPQGLAHAVVRDDS